jgi:hypothetical protein
MWSIPIAKEWKIMTDKLMASIDWLNESSEKYIYAFEFKKNNINVERKQFMCSYVGQQLIVNLQSELAAHK